MAPPLARALARRVSALLAGPSGRPALRAGLATSARPEASPPEADPGPPPKESSPSRRLADTVPRSVVDDIFRCALKKQQGVSLKYMMDFGRQVEAAAEEAMRVSADFLHEELPVRLAHRVAELENLPLGLSEKPQVRRVRDWYVDSFCELRSFPPIRSRADVDAFTGLVGQIKNRHNNVVPMLAMGVASLKEDLRMGRAANGFRGAGLTGAPDIHSFLDRFYMSRIGIRMLIMQHLALADDEKGGAGGGAGGGSSSQRIGLIDRRLCPAEVAHDAIQDARYMCSRDYGSAPAVDVYCGSPDLRFAYVPEHLHHMLFELVKNSLKAVADRYEDADDEPPPIRVVIAGGEEDVTIKVSDEGGGIPRRDIGRIWTYLYSTAQSPLQVLHPNELESSGDVGVGSTAGAAVLAGYGYGLPISRLYARYFGGDLQVVSMEGYGTDAYLHLNRLADSEEALA